MHRLARTGGTAELLRWLAGRAGGWAGVVGPDGTVLHAAARTARSVVPDVAALVAEVASALTERGAQAYSLDTGAHTALLFPLSADDRAAPVLAVITPGPWPPGSPRCWPTWSCRCPCAGRPRPWSANAAGWTSRSPGAGRRCCTC